MTREEIINFLFEDELHHHGILGMKWGVRRYQNPDGSLTAEGRERLGIGPSRSSSKSQSRSSRYKKVSSTKVPKMSQQERKRIIDAIFDNAAKIAIATVAPNERTADAATIAYQIARGNTVGAINTVGNVASKEVRRRK